MHGQDPAVVRLETHLEDQNTMIFSDEDKLDEIIKKSNNDQMNCLV